MPVRLTEQEAKLLKAIYESEYHSASGEERIQEPVWVDCIWGFEGKSKFGGVMSSLKKKGLASTDGECCWITKEGFEALTSNEVIR